MTPTSHESDWRTYILDELRGLRREQAEARAANSAENREIQTQVNGLRVDLETLKEKSRLWGSLFGAAGGIGAALIARIIKHT